MEVRVVDWDAIPKEHHKDILQALSYGEYVKSLPYSIPDGLKTFRIPLYSRATLYNKPDGMGLPCMEFEKTRALTPSGESAFIWRRV